MRNEEELSRIVHGLGAELIGVEFPRLVIAGAPGFFLRKNCLAISRTPTLLLIYRLCRRVSTFLAAGSANCLVRGDKGGARLELQVLVTENPDLDDAIGGDGTL